MAKKQSKSFLGTGWGFPPEFKKRNESALINHPAGVEMVNDEDDIEQSLGILLSTIPGERIMEPRYGCGVKKMVFETISLTMTTRIKNIIEKAVLLYEPRITVEKIDVSDGTDLGLHRGEGVLYIDLHYKIITTNTRRNMVYPFYLKEGTDIPNLSSLSAQ
ncbi:MAG: GPW/gp25 family protein [Bacteroidota bacterium]